MNTLIKNITAQNQLENQYTRKRWLMLGLTWLLVVIVFGSIQIVSPLSFALMPELNLNISQLMMIYTAPILVAIFFSIPGGMLGDRYGVRFIIGLGAIIIGISGTLRMFPSEFATEFVVSGIMGVGWGFIFPNLPKVVSNWFPPKQQGMASAIYLTSIAGGTVFVFSTTVFFYGSSWRTAFLSMGSLSLVVGLLWWLIARNGQQAQVSISRRPVFLSIKEIIKSKNIWLVAFGYAAFNGGLNSLNGITPHSLETVHNVNPSIANLVVSMITLGSVGSILLPAISDRIGLRKPFLYATSLLSFILIFLGWYTAYGIWTWGLMLAGGIALGVLPALLLTLPMEIPEIKPESVGSASGLVLTIGNTGGFFISSYLIPALETPDMNLAFLVATGILGMVLVISLFLNETGYKSRRV